MRCVVRMDVLYCLHGPPGVADAAHPWSSLEYQGLRPGSSQTQFHFGIARKGWKICDVLILPPNLRL